MLLDKNAGTMAYWEPQHGADGTTGVACVFTTPVLQMSVTQQHLLTQAEAVSQPFVYYHGAAWDKAGEIRTANEWFEYTRQFQTRLKNPLSISIK
jgi:hypothetical protein